MGKIELGRSFSGFYMGNEEKDSCLGVSERDGHIVVNFPGQTPNTDTGQKTVDRLPCEVTARLKPSQVEKFGIKSGDQVDGRVINILGIISLCQIRSVNGRKINLLEDIILDGNVCRSKIEWENRENRRREEIDFSGNSYAKLVSAIFPIPKGSSVILSGDRASGKSTVLFELLKGTREVDWVMYALTERTDEIPQCKPLPENDKLPVLPDGVELWAQSMRKRDAPKEMVGWINFALEVAISRAEAGEHVVFFLDSLEVYAKLSQRVLQKSPDEKDRILSGGIDPRVLDKIAGKFLSQAGHPLNGGSLTIIATYRLNENDRGTKSMAEEFEGVVNGHIHMLPAEQHAEQPILIDIANSTSRRLEYVLGEEEAKKIWRFQRAAAGIGEYNIKGRFTKDQWEKLLQAAETLDVRDIRDHWERIVSNQNSVPAPAVSERSPLTTNGDYHISSKRSKREIAYDIEKRIGELPEEMRTTVREKLGKVQGDLQVVYEKLENIILEIKQASVSASVSSASAVESTNVTAEITPAPSTDGENGNKGEWNKVLEEIIPSEEKRAEFDRRWREAQKEVFGQ